MSRKGFNLYMDFFIGIRKITPKILFFKNFEKLKFKVVGRLFPSPPPPHTFHIAKKWVLFFA